MMIMTSSDKKLTPLFLWPDYSIFVVRGHLEDSVADRRARTLPRPQVQKKTQDNEPFGGRGYSLNEPFVPEAEEQEDEEAQLSRAIELSLQQSQQQPAMDMDEIRRKRLAKLGQK